MFQNMCKFNFIRCEIFRHFDLIVLKQAQFSPCEAITIYFMYIKKKNMDDQTH